MVSDGGRGRGCTTAPGEFGLYPARTQSQPQSQLLFDHPMTSINQPGEVWDKAHGTGARTIGRALECARTLELYPGFRQLVCVPLDAPRDGTQILGSTSLRVVSVDTMVIDRMSILWEQDRVKESDGAVGNHCHCRRARIRGGEAFSSYLPVERSDLRSAEWLKITEFDENQGRDQAVWLP
jgi:hypothetical protein